MGRKAQVLVILFLLGAAVPAAGSCIEIGGVGAVSTSDEPYGSLGLLDGGEVATATLEFDVTGLPGSAQLILTVTNTSPAVLGTDSPLVPDAPVISDIYFSTASVVATVELVTVGGVAAEVAGWEFAFDPDAAPGTGLGFLSSVFDTELNGGPGSGSPDPVIASIFDPNIADDPGDPVTSPVDFVFSLGATGGVFPTGFSGDWFSDPAILDWPEYIAAAKFISGANDGSGTVTNGIPVPGALALGLIGVALVSLARAGRTRQDGQE